MVDKILAFTILDEQTLACPLCDFTLDVPPVPVIEGIGAALGMSGHTLALVHAEREAERASADMRKHLADHDVLDWLPRVVA